MRVAVFGLGLIGGSVALALTEKMRGTAHEIVGYDPSSATREAAAGRLAVTADPSELLDADIAVVAAPMGVIDRVAAETVPADRFDGLVTDVASVKGPVARAFADHKRFVGGHPMAGKETAGFAAADPGLFEGCTWVLCLEEDTRLGDWAALARLWISLGAKIVPTTAAAHDAAVARISHIEHLIAAALTLNAADPLSRTLGAGSFRDGTRVASSPAHLVEGMVAGNQLAVFEALSGFDRELSAARYLLSESAVDGPEGLRNWWDRARELRSSWPPRPGEPESIQLTRENLLDLGEAGGWVESVAANDVATIRRPRVQSTS